MREHKCSGVAGDVAESVAREQATGGRRGARVDMSGLCREGRKVVGHGRGHLECLGAVDTLARCNSLCSHSSVAVVKRLRMASVLGLPRRPTLDVAQKVCVALLQLLQWTYVRSLGHRHGWSRNGTFVFLAHPQHHIALQPPTAPCQARNTCTAPHAPSCKSVELRTSRRKLPSICSVSAAVLPNMH